MADYPIYVESAAALLRYDAGTISLIVCGIVFVPTNDQLGALPTKAQLDSGDFGPVLFDITPSQPVVIRVTARVSGTAAAGIAL